MDKRTPYVQYEAHLRILLCMVLLEYLMFIFSGVSFSSLYADTFYNIEVDPAYWIFYLAEIPQLILSHYWLGITLDISIILLLVYLIRYPFNNKPAIPAFLFLFVFYISLTGYLGHRNYQSGFIWILVPFLFRKGINRSFAYEAVRYYLLFFYVSAAIFKIADFGIFQSSMMREILVSQFTPYFLEGNTGIRTTVNLFLVHHENIAALLYLAAFTIELIAVIGFFTRRFDRFIGVAILLFHFANWFIMDIAPIGQIAFVCLLFADKKYFSGKSAG